MATRLEEILIRVRDSLSDPDKDRWTDARLLRLADDAQKLIAKHANLLRAKVDIPLAALVAEYSVPPTVPGTFAVWTGDGTPIYINAPPGVIDYALPPDIYRVTRVLNENGNPVPVMSHEQADRKFGDAWEAEIGSPMQALIFDKVAQNRLKVYPIPEETTPTEISTEIGNLNSIYGVTVAGGLESTYDVIDSPYGVLVGIAQITNVSFTIYYLRVATLVSTITDTLEIGSVFDQALKFYITGMALLDDKDTENRARGSAELKFFDTELIKAKTESSKNSTSQGQQYVVPYVGGFDT